MAYSREKILIFPNTVFQYTVQRSSAVASPQRISHWGYRHHHQDPTSLFQGGGSSRPWERKGTRRDRAWETADTHTHTLSQVHIILSSPQQVPNTHPQQRYSIHPQLKESISELFIKPQSFHTHDINKSMVILLDTEKVRQK